MHTTNFKSKKIRRMQNSKTGKINSFVSENKGKSSGIQFLEVNLFIALNRVHSVYIPSWVFYTKNRVHLKNLLEWMIFGLMYTFFNHGELYKLLYIWKLVITINVYHAVSYLPLISCSIASLFNRLIGNALVYTSKTIDKKLLFFLLWILQISMPIFCVKNTQKSIDVTRQCRGQTVRL